MKTSKADTSYNILVIDDEPTVQMVLGDMLRLKGYQVDVVSDGDEGVAAFKAARQQGQPYDTVLLDLTMPGGKSGKVIVQELLAIAPETRVIAISGYSSDPIMSQYEAFGFRGRLVKPFRLQEVVDEIVRVCSSMKGNRL